MLFFELLVEISISAIFSLPRLQIQKAAEREKKEYEKRLVYATTILNEFTQLEAIKGLENIDLDLGIELEGATDGQAQAKAAMAKLQTIDALIPASMRDDKKKKGKKAVKEETSELFKK